jgi:hypothetical protein
MNVQIFRYGVLLLIKNISFFPALLVISLGPLTFFTFLTGEEALAFGFVEADLALTAGLAALTTRLRLKTGSATVDAFLDRQKLEYLQFSVTSLIMSTKGGSSQSSLRPLQ